MQSKKSSSKGALLSATLLKKNLSRFWPLWGGASLAGCVLPLYLLLNLLSPYYYSNRHATPSMMAQSLYGVFCYAVPIISLLYAILWWTGSPSMKTPGKRPWWPPSPTTGSTSPPPPSGT